MATDTEGSVMVGSAADTAVDAPPALDHSRERMLRTVRRARRAAVATLAIEALALVACLGFLAAPMRAPVTLLTFLVLGGLFATMALAAVAVAAAVQRLAMPHTPVDDEVEVHVGWRAPVAVVIFVVAVIVSLLAVPEGLPTMRNGDYGYLDPGVGFVRLREEDYAELVLQQLRFVATFATVFAAWVAMSLTRRHAGWDSPQRG